MLITIGYIMIAVFMFLVMTKRMTALVALILVPFFFAVISGFYSNLDTMILEGIKTLAPTGVMLLFAILYFGVMIDAGLFDPLISAIVSLVKGDPLKIVIGTAILTLIVSLDGDGTTTYLISISAMYPLYHRLKMNPLILSCIVMLGAGITNIIPWGGPTVRVMSALNLEANVIFTPLIPALIGGAIWVIIVAYILGKNERKRLGIVAMNIEKKAILPKYFKFNLLLTTLLMIALISNFMPLAILFMLAFAIAILINYPNAERQSAFFATHGAHVLAVISLIFAAGVFTGILTGTKMIDAMAHGLVALIPNNWGQHLPIITALSSIPFTFFMTNDAYYFGVVPILAKTAANYGIDPVLIGRASLLGQPVHILSPLVASTYLLVGIAKVNFADHQRFTFAWAVGSSFVMILIAFILGII